MNPIKNMDLYKGVILASVVLLPGAGWWIKESRQGIQVAQRAITEATRSGGILERIAELQRKVMVVENNKVTTSDATEKHSLYFDGQIYRSDANRSLEKNDFVIGAAREEPAFMGGGSRQRATDYVVKIDFAKQNGKDLKMPREFLFAVLFNCESGARSEQSTQLSAIWKLRSLTFQNATVRDVFPTRKTPPRELEDEWIVKDLQFARRVPSKDRK